MNKKIGSDFLPKSITDNNYIKLLDFLLEKKLINKQKKDAVLAEYSVTDEHVGMILVRNGFITHKTYIESVLEFDPDAIINEETISNNLDYEFLLEHQIMMIAETKEVLYLATLSDEEYIKSELKILFPKKEFIFLPVVFEKINRYLDNIEQILYSENSFLDRLLNSALKRMASDIHILPKDKSYSIFFRIIGINKHVHEGDIDEYNKLVGRIKNASNIDVAERRVPHDGGFQKNHNGKMIDFRVSTIPLVEGAEKITIRLLDPDKIQPSLDLLGISNVEAWRKGVSRTNGLALICGPTGSGKTTTLQASIREMNRFEKAIYTAEDPVEYRIPYVAQVNINHIVGLNFPRSLKAFMRADPDVIIVGEIRDEETARNAIKAAETGHMVLGTLHTGDIRGSIDRMRDLGVPMSEMRTVLRTILVQRLVRTLCEECDGKGCNECEHDGYVGRTIVSECEYFKDEKAFDKILEDDVNWTLMIDDAVNKVKQGITNANEIIAVFGEEGREALERHNMM